jgi:hypothetical protein
MVHVGKTAGKTVACQLGEGQTSEGTNLMCPGYVPPPSALQEAFAGRTHMWDHGHRCERASFSAFLFVLRNPLERLTSWYFYEHPKRMFGYYRGTKESNCPRQFHKWEGSKVFANGCFGNLEEFALSTIPPENATKHQHLCQKLAWDVATGKQRCPYHNAFGYSYYLRRSQQLAALKPKAYRNLVIRTEHLSEDWDQLDRAFGGKMNVNGTVRFGHPPASQNASIHSESDSNEVDRLSDAGRKNLCRALCFEIQVYKTILKMAENLDDRQVRESIQEVIVSCPGETLEIRKCPPPVYAVCPKPGGYDLPYQGSLLCLTRRSIVGSMLTFQLLL